jgi:ABC-2 type transport system permease protein
MTAGTTPGTLPLPASAAPAGLRSPLAREANAVLAIAWRELLSAVKSPVSIAFNILFPIIFIGILGGSINQNLGTALPYPYLPFMIVGMVANSITQGSIVGVTNLVEERQNDFTAELFVAPISRYAVLLGKIMGAGAASLVSLIGIFAMIVVLQVPMDAGDLLRVVALAPILALSGGALGVFFIGFVHDPKTAGAGVALLVFPQMFLAGALIPVSQSTGLLGLLAKIMPMTYSIDLARNIFYAGKPEAQYTVLHDPLLDLAVTVGYFILFTVVGTYLFVRNDRNR